jgi:uncharacterized protein (DUF58 family)
LTNTLTRYAAKLIWIANPAIQISAVLAVVLAGGSLAFSRPLLALGAVPLVVACAVAWLRRGGTTDVEFDTDLLVEPASHDIRFSSTVTPPDGAATAVLRLIAKSQTSAWVVIDTAGTHLLTGVLSPEHSGPQELLRIDHQFVGEAGSAVTVPGDGPKLSRVVSPPIARMRGLPLPPRMAGLTGGHGSVRAGEGGEFRDIGLFRAGDRLRRIDWKVTARRARSVGELYVRHTFATADATIQLVVDSRDSVIQLVVPRHSRHREQHGVSSADNARAAASSLASAYIRQGDRVGFLDLAGSSRVIPAGGGTGHLGRLLPAIARATPIGAAWRHVRAPIVPSGALIYVISTFLDDEAGRLATLWRASGHRVIAIDTLPGQIVTGLRREEQAAVRFLLLEREQTLAAMTGTGVELVGWDSSLTVNPEIALELAARPVRPR